MMPICAPRVLVSAMVVSLALHANAIAGSPMGQLEVRVTDHKPGINQFSALDVTLSSVALHEKGQGRREGWVDIVGETEAIDIVPLKDGRFQSLGLSDVPAGAYDAVAVRFAAIEGQLKTDGDLTIWFDDAIISIDLAVTDHDNEPLVLDLYAEDQTEHDPPRYEVKVKEVRLGE